MQKIIYDIDRKVFRNTNGLVRTGFRPSLSYGERAVWQIEIQATDAGAVSLGGASAWRAAIDQDFSVSTEPMARTTSGITVDASGVWPVATVAIDTLTERYLSVCDGRQTTPVFFELAGLNGSGDTVFYLCFPIDALFPIDPQASGALAPVATTDLTEAQIRAIVQEAVGSAVAPDLSGYYTKSQADSLLAAKAASSDLSAEATARANGDNALDSRVSILEAASGGGSDLSGYYTKNQTDELLSAEATARTNAVNALDIRVGALEQGGGGASSDGITPVDELPAPSAANAGRVYLLIGTGRVWQSRRIGTAAAPGVRLVGDTPFSGNYLPTGDTTSVTYQDMGTLQQVTAEYPVYSNGEKFLFAIVNSYALAPLYAVGTTVSVPEYYAPSVEIGALTGEWYNSDYSAHVSVTAMQYAMDDITHAQSPHTHALEDVIGLPAALAGKISAPETGAQGQYLQKTATGVQWSYVSGGGGTSTPDVSGLETVRIIPSRTKYEAFARDLQQSPKTTVFMPVSGATEDNGKDWTDNAGLAEQAFHTLLLLPFHWRFWSSPFAWPEFVIEGKYARASFTGGTCKLEGVDGTVTLTPGTGNESTAADFRYGSTPDAFPPSEENIATSLTGCCLYPSGMPGRIQVDVKLIDGILKWSGVYQLYDDSTGTWQYGGKFCYDLECAYSVSYFDRGHWKNTSEIIDIQGFFTVDITRYVTSYAVPGASSAKELEISPGQRLVWTLEADSTLSAKAINEAHWATAQIEISTGSHKVTAGSNLVVVDTLTANAVNVCEARWRNGAARLKVVDVITGGGGGDTPQPTPTITAPPSQSVEGKQGEEMTASIVTGVSASNGASVSFAVKQGSALPAGLALSSAGDVTGTPAAAGNTTTTVVVSADGCADVEMSVSFAISEAAVSDGFPKSFTVSSVSYQGQSITAPCGTYTRTGEAFQVVMDGVAYPVYSYTGSDGKTYYICVVAYMFGGDAPAWMLTGTKPTASSVTTSYAASGYGGVTLKSGAYEPSSTSWSGNQGSVTVSWEM